MAHTEARQLVAEIERLLQRLKDRLDELAPEQWPSSRSIQRPLQVDPNLARCETAKRENAPKRSREVVRLQGHNCYSQQDG